MLSNPKMLVNSIIQAPNNNYPNRSFVLEKLIGQGAEGCVYLGKVCNWNNKVNDKIAIKLQQNMKQDELQFLKSLIQTQNQFEQANNPKLLNKIQLASSNIIRIYETFNWKDCNVILMEAGVQNLERYLQSQQQQPLQNKLQILKQITQAIQFLHLNGLIHRDIKPENFIQVGNQFKLIDFGLVRQDNNNRLKTTQVGTPLYSSPEIFEESNLYTQSVDIWSLACVFYEMIESYPLISGNTIEQVKHNVLIHKYQQDGIYNKIDILEIPSQLKSLLKQMLAPSPEKRYSIDQVLDQLTNIIEKDTQQLSQKDNQIINEKKDNSQQQKFRNYSPIPQSKTDQNFFIQQNQQHQINCNQLMPIQNFQPIQINNQQNDIQNQIKNGILQIQQLLGTQVQQAQVQNKDLIEQIKSLTQQNRSLIEQTEKNQQQIENLQKKLFDKEKDDQRYITSNQSNRKQCNCDLENKQLLIELKKFIEKEYQSNLEQMKKMLQNYQYIEKISINLEEIQKQTNDQNGYTKKYYQNVTTYLNEFSSKISGKIENSDHQMQQSIQQLKQMNQSWLSQNKQKGQTENDEFNITVNNQNENNQIIFKEIYKQTQNLNNKLINALENMIQQSMGILINSVKEDIQINFQTFAQKGQQINGQLNQQNKQNLMPTTTQRKNEHSQQQPSSNSEQNQQQQNSRFRQIPQQQANSNKQEGYYYKNQ